MEAELITVAHSLELYRTGVEPQRTIEIEIGTLKWLLLIVQPIQEKGEITRCRKQGIAAQRMVRKVASISQIQHGLPMLCRSWEVQLLQSQT